MKVDNQEWECNACGFREYTTSVSEDDVQRLGCSNCGGDEFHLAPVLTEFERNKKELV